MRRIFFFAVLLMLPCQAAFAQVDLMGVWRPLPRNQDGSGMTGDVAGGPVSDAARWRLQSWSAEDFDVNVRGLPPARLGLLARGSAFGIANLGRHRPGDAKGHRISRTSESAGAGDHY